MDITTLTDGQLEKELRKAKRLAAQYQLLVAECKQEQKQRILDKYPDLQELAARFASKRGLIAGATCEFQEWIWGYDVGGIKVGETIDEAYQYLKSQVG